MSRFSMVLHPSEPAGYAEQMRGPRTLEVLFERKTLHQLQTICFGKMKILLLSSALGNSLTRFVKAKPHRLRKGGSRALLRERQR